MADDDVADLDLGRGARRGYPEAVFCEGKTAEQVRAIAARLRQEPGVALFTRANPDHAAATDGWAGRRSLCRYIRSAGGP